MRIKIACPHNTVTGGIELLHQTAAELNKYDGVTAELWYVFGRSVKAIPDDYLVYGNTVNNIIEDGDVLLFPEIWAHFTNDPAFRDHQKIVYWESVDNYFPHTPKDQWYKFGENTLHISQSEYSNRFLSDVLKVSQKDIIEITDYVNADYLNSNISGERQPVVLYNPAKGMEYAEKIIRAGVGIEFKPVKGMTRQQVLDLMKQSMVWIDFGNFPGKDRLPREAGACGMCLITGKKGTAKYHKDLAIPDEYKIDDFNYADLGRIIDMIRDIFSNFDDHQKKFASYRKRLKQEKTQFEQGIKQLYEVLNHNSGI